MRTIVIILALLVTGCSQVKYSSTSDATFNFAALNTYQVIPDGSGKAVVGIHPIVREQIEKSINLRMEQLGYTKGYPQPPSFVVSFRIESEWDPRLSPEEIRTRLGFSGSHFPDADPRARDYQILTLVIEIGSPAEKKVLWTGKAAGVQYIMGRSGWELVEAANELMKQFQPDAL